MIVQRQRAEPLAAERQRPVRNAKPAHRAGGFSAHGVDDGNLRLDPVRVPF